MYCVYAHIPKDERKKLDSKAKKYVLLGYGTETKGYRLYDPQIVGMLNSMKVNLALRRSCQGMNFRLINM
jgi:hypothetical protein